MQGMHLNNIWTYTAESSGSKSWNSSSWQQCLPLLSSLQHHHHACTVQKSMQSSTTCSYKKLKQSSYVAACSHSKSILFFKKCSWWHKITRTLISQITLILSHSNSKIWKPHNLNAAKKPGQGKKWNIFLLPLCATKKDAYFPHQWHIFKRISGLLWSLTCTQRQGQLRSEAHPLS